jgi:hypothetical protein
VQALSSAGDLVIPSRKAEMHPRIEWQRYKIDRCAHAIDALRPVQADARHRRASNRMKLLLADRSTVEAQTDGC